MEAIYQITKDHNHGLRLLNGEFIALNKEQHHTFKELMKWNTYHILSLDNEIITLTTDAEDYINTFRTDKCPYCKAGIPTKIINL